MAIALGLSCANRTAPPVIPPPSPAPAATVNYWFSRAQKETLLSLGEINAARFHPMLVDGKEYTECQKAAEPIGRFRDYVLVAQTNTGPCAQDAGEWED